MIRRLTARLRDGFWAALLPPLQRRGIVPTTVVEQKLLSAVYRQLYQAQGEPLTLQDVGFRIHSQNEEDGILLYLFALIGTTNRRCVEICAGDGMECNTANLILHHRWVGLLCDGDQANIDKANKFYAHHPDTKVWPPAILKAWFTRDNVNTLLQEQGFTGEIDLLSLDVDGIDYWLWKELSCVSPRAVVLEFNHLWGSDRSVTVPYRDDFVCERTPYGSDYAGASLQAFVKLGRQKGYRLVGSNAIATNAFFIRQDIPCAWLPEIDPATCFSHPRAHFGRTHRLPAVANKEWVEV